MSGVNISERAAGSGTDGERQVVDTQLPREDFYAAVFDQLKDAEKGIVVSLLSVPDMPAGTALESWLFVKDDDATVVRDVLNRLQNLGLVAFTGDWLWIVDQTFRDYLETLTGIPKLFPNRKPESFSFDTGSIRGSNSYFFGKLIFSIVRAEKWRSIAIQLSKRIGSEEDLTPLPAFIYRKPVVDNQFFSIPTAFEESQRVGYVPLLIVKGVRRPPGHLYQDENMLVAAKNLGTKDEPKWEFRCFPQSCIPEETWVMAEQRLEDDDVKDFTSPPAP